MTSTMSVSRIPVPVRNFDDATLLRTISAKTRLERLRDEFQRRLLFEKHAKLHDFYTQKQRHETKADASRRFGSGEIGYGRYRNPEVTTDFNSEREAGRHGQKNGYTSPNIFPNDPGNFHGRPPLPPYPKRSAGRDRAHPLAPINPARPNHVNPKIREGQADESGSLAPSPDILGDTYTLRKLNPETAEQRLAPRPPPVMNRPKIVRPYVRNRSHQVQFQNEADGQGKGQGKGQFDQPNLERLKQRKLRHLNEEISDGSNHSLQNQGKHVLPSPGAVAAEGKRDEVEDLPKKAPVVSDLQKWQAEQNQERARRLQRLNKTSRTQKEGSSFHKENGIRDDQKEPSKEQSRHRMEDDVEDEKMQNQIQRQKQRILQRHNRKEEAIEVKLDDEEEDLEDERLKQKERELQELIRRQEEELQKLRQEKFGEEEEEKRKEIENVKRQAKFHQQKQRILEEEMSQQKTKHNSRTPPPVDENSEMTSSVKAARNRVTRRTSVASLPPKQMWAPEVDPSNEETAFYLQKAMSEGNHGADEVTLVPCQVCGRSFASDRLAKHEKICSKESKKTRKVFDHVAMRYRGTDFENHIKRRESITEEPVNEKKSHWRAKHQNFMDTMQYVKKVTKIKSEGGNLSSLPPPPVTLNPDYIQCPHCQRRFNEKAADRHIPWCKDANSRQPLKLKGRRQ